MPILSSLFTVVLTSLLLGAAVPALGDTLTGAGSSAAAPVYRAWAAAYARSRDFKLAYEPVGSSAGLKKIRAREVGFGASDVAPSAQELAKDRLVLVPTFVTGAVPVVNLPGFANGKLRLSGEVLARIYLGNITRWNAPEIRSLNAGQSLPDLPVRPVARSDGSGTTYYFTDYLSAVSTEWKSRFGARTSQAWPTVFAAVKGSDGVAAMVKNTVGAIGYVDFNYVKEYGLQTVQLRNAEGEFVMPGVDAFRATLSASEWSTKGDFHASLANLPGIGNWPITMGTFVLLPKVSQDSVQTRTALRFFVWTLVKGDQVVEGLSMVRLPDRLQALAYKALSSLTDQRGQPLGLDALSAASRD